MDTNNTNFGGLECMETHQQFERIDDDEESNQQLQLTDLIQEFLEQIFMYLDLASIVRAADVCTQFRKATKLPFKRKYAKNLVEVAITPKSSEFYHLKGVHVTITNLKIGMSMLRCFGDTITQLKITNPNLIKLEEATYKTRWVKKYRDVLFYANDYCHESLTTFSVEPLFYIDIDHIWRPFSNVQNLCILFNMDYISFNYYNNYWPLIKRHNLNEKFPQLRCLTTDTLFGIEFATEPLPNLQELMISGEGCNVVKVVRSLQLNPHLRKFAIEFCVDETGDIYDFVRHLQYIQEFDFKCKSVYWEWSAFSHNLKEQIHLPNVRIFKLNLDTAGNPLPKIPFEFSQLKSFSLEGDFIYSETFYNFIKRHSTITSLFLRFKLRNKNRNFLDKFKLMSALPLLEEIAILPSNEISIRIHAMINYLTNFDSVNRCMFYCRAPKADVIACCGTKWNVQITPHNNYLTMVKLTRTH